MNKLTHLDAEDTARMVDSGDKAKSLRKVRAEHPGDIAALTAAALIIYDMCKAMIAAWSLEVSCCGTSPLVAVESGTPRKKMH